MGTVTDTDLPCPYEEECGSSDAFVLYDDGSGHCFSCGKVKDHQQLLSLGYGAHPFMKKAKKKMGNKYKGMPEDAGFFNIKDRMIRKDVCEAFGVTQKKGYHYYPYQDETGETVGYKERDVVEKGFTQKGGNNTNVFGLAQAIKHTNKRFLTITEGELDAMSHYQMTNNLSPVISVPSAGQAKKACEHHMEWMSKFDVIKLCFDDDKVGKKAAKDVSKIFEVGQCQIVTFDKENGYKDANDYLMKGSTKKYTSAWYAGEAWSPSVIINGDKLLSRIKDRKAVEYVPYPWEGLNELLFGMAPHQLIAIKAPPKVGKTQFTRELEYHLLKKTELNIGCMFLEEPVETSAEGLMSVHAQIPFHRPDASYTDAQHTLAHDETIGIGRVYYYDHFGSCDLDEVLSHIRYMVVRLKCRFIILDHISIMMPKGDEKDGRKQLEDAATRIKKLTIELPFTFICVSHVNDDGKFRDSRILMQVSDIVIDLKRDILHEDKEERNKTYITVEANRWLGDSGPACVLTYDKKTGRMVECENSDNFEDDEL